VVYVRVIGSYLSTPTPTLFALPSRPRTIVSPLSFTLCVGGGSGKFPMSAEQGPSDAVDMVVVVWDYCKHVWGERRQG
jgi:hypothetical protein